MKSSNIPIRKCTGCLKSKPKSELIRIVRSPSTREIVIDKTGKKDGRGAYICKDKKCFEVAQKSRKIERSLKCKISDDLYEELCIYE